MGQVSIVKLGKTIAELLGSGDFSMAFEPVFRFTPVSDLTDKRLRVYTVPQGRTTELDGPSQKKRERRINIAIQQQIELEKIDAEELVGLGEQIEDFIADRSRHAIKVDGATFVFSKIETTFLFAPDLLRENDEFLSVATVTYFSLES